MKSTATYTPISCGIYDQLELYAMRRQTIQLELIDDSRRLIRTQGIIEDLWARDGVEYGRLKDGQEFRLDELMTVNGQAIEAESCLFMK